jgi:aerobic-type carbon monoxide dehydrogenase small subunit (CoxS/CutS family)
VYQVDRMIQKAMLDSPGNNKGYFTSGDFAFVAMMRPNEHWTDDEIEQTLQQLVQENKIREIEPGKYKPASGGDGGY